MKTRTLMTLGLATAALAALATHAAVVVETFNYDPVPNLMNTATTGTGQQGNYGSFWFSNNVSGNSDASIQSGSLAAPTGYGYTPTNNRLGYDEENTDNPGELTSDGNLVGTAYFELAGATKIDFGADATYYMSFLIRSFSNNNTGAQIDFQTDTGSSIFVIGETTGDFGQLSVNGIQSSGIMDTNGVNFDGMDNLVVLKIETLASGNDTLSASFWTSGVDTLGTEPVTWDINTTIDNDSLAAGFRIDLNDGFSDLDTSLDEILIGSSFADVTAVPEPSTYALLAGFMGLGLVLIRRRMR